MRRLTLALLCAIILSAPVTVHASTRTPEPECLRITLFRGGTYYLGRGCPK